MTEEGSVFPAESVRAEAAAWVARLHGSGRSPALEAGLRNWLKADAAHAQAFELATEAWDLGGSVKAASLPRMADPFQEAPRRSPVQWLAIAAAVAVMTIGAIFYATRGTPPVSTAVGEQRMLTLEDGTRVFLNTDTRIVVQKDRRYRRVKLENGEALFDVTKDRRHPFIVTVGDREVTALGTSFVVRRDDAQLSVTLVEGKVAVAPIPDQEPSPENSAAVMARGAILAPGQRLTFVKQAPPRLDEPAIEKVTAWRRGEVILDKTPLRDAVDEMNRYSAVKLRLEGEDLATIRVSGIFRAGDSVRFAQAIGATYHLAVMQETRQILISHGTP